MDNNMADKIKAMLEDPEMMNTLSALIGSMQQPTDTNVQDIQSDEVSQMSENTYNQAEAISKIQQMMGQVSPANDPRINLLNSLKPYMRKNRSAKMDQAIRLIQISKMANLFKL